MDRRVLLEQIQFLAMAVGACVLGHLLVYRRLLGMPSVEPHEVPPDDRAPFAVSALCVLIAVALAGRLVRSRRAAIAGAIVAGAAAEAYFVGSDWLRAGWGGLVGHDIWFGGREYWMLVCIQAALVIVAFVVAVATTWGINRHPRTSRTSHDAG